MEGCERADGINVSIDGTSPVRADGSDMGSAVHEEVGSCGYSDGLNVLVEQRISFPPDPVIPHAFPMSSTGQ